MATFKTGDRVRLVNLECSGGNEKYIGQEAIVTKQVSESAAGYIHLESGAAYSVYSSEIELIKSNSTTMSSTEKFALIFKSEPEKSLRKAGLINGDDLATTEGIQLYVTYLMKNDTKFKTDVVDPILAEEKK